MLGAKVAGLDNFNEYYSPAYKRARASHLESEHGLRVVDGDVCDRKLVKDILDKHRITHIVHLAAQPGVR